jgi:hypothetical protein
MSDLEARLRSAATEWYECCGDIHLLLIEAADRLARVDTPKQRLSCTICDEPIEVGQPVEVMCKRCWEMNPPASVDTEARVRALPRYWIAGIGEAVILSDVLKGDR